MLPTLKVPETVFVPERVAGLETLSVKLASVITPQLSVARIVIVCVPTGAALLIATMPVELLTEIPPE